MYIIHFTHFAQDRFFNPLRHEAVPLGIQSQQPTQWKEEQSKELCIYKTVKIYNRQNKGKHYIENKVSSKNIL